MKPRRNFSLHSSKHIAASTALLSLLVVMCAVGIVSSTAQSVAEREFEDKIPKHLPIKVKIKKEKEKAFKDLQNEKWARDLELEVTNTADKPIYFLALQLILPEIKSPDSYPMGFSLRYGRIELIDLGARLLPEDVPILPGQSYVFKLSEKKAKAWEAFASEEKLPKTEPKKVRLQFYVLNFGDGSGFQTKIGMPFPKPLKQHSSNTPPERRGRQSGMGSTNALLSNSPGPFLQLTSFFLPAKGLPVNFCLEETENFIYNRIPVQSNVCCPGTNCSYRRPSSYTCLCKEDAFTTESASCNDGFGICSIDERIDEACIDENGVRRTCPEFFIGPCSSPTPSPSPPPSPSPSSSPPPDCDPNTRPNNTNCDCAPMPFGSGNYWLCVCPGGVPHANYHQFPQTGCDPDKR